MSVDVPENTGSEIENSKKPSSTKKGVDLQQLMMEINASVFTPAEQQAAARKQMMILSKGTHHQVHPLDDEEDEDKQHPELITFRAGGPKGKVKCRLSKKSAVF